MSEIHEHRIKRLKMRSMRRGIKEMDLILPPFAEAHLPDMDDAQLTLYEQMLNEIDHDLYQWVTGQEAPPAEYADFIASIQAGLKPLSV